MAMVDAVGESDLRRRWMLEAVEDAGRGEEGEEESEMSWLESGEGGWEWVNRIGNGWGDEVMICSSAATLCCLG